MKATLPLHVIIISAVAFLRLSWSAEDFTSTRRISNEGVNSECEIYLAPSLTAALGRGLIAGNDSASGQELGTSIALAVRYHDFKSTQLMYYFYGTHEDDISLAAIGLDMIFNHRETESIKRNWESHEMRNYADQKLAHTTHNNVVLSIKLNVSGRFYHDDLTSILAKPFWVLNSSYSWRGNILFLRRRALV
jgi:hypothetical protein